MSRLKSLLLWKRIRFLEMEQNPRDLPKRSWFQQRRD